MKHALTFAFLALASPIAAETPMTASEFERLVIGRTLAYGANGEVYGAESYHSDRRVTWTFLDGECEQGHWYPKGEAICFVYEFEPEPHCWLFFDDSAGLRAEFLDEDGLTTLYQVEDMDDGLICPGPDVGV